MRRTAVVSLVFLLLATGGALASASTLLDRSYRPLAGKTPVSLATAYGGDVLLVVNTASKCGYTPQFEALEALHRKYAGRGFAVVAPETADWFADHDIAVVGADNIAVEATGRRGVLPPLHERLVCQLGVTLIEMLDLRGPAADGITSGMLVVAPLRISRGVGSPVNPLLIT
jgi:kynurenine formamidase